MLSVVSLPNTPPQEPYSASAAPSRFGHTGMAPNPHEIATFYNKLIAVRAAPFQQSRDAITL